MLAKFYATNLNSVMHFSPEFLWPPRMLPTFFPVIAFVSFLLTLAGTILLVPLVRDCASARGWFDQPSARKIHAVPVPRLGGVAVFLATMAGLLLQFSYYQIVDLDTVLFPRAYFVPACLMFLIGLLDDLRSLPAILKLIAQAAVATLVFSSGIQTHSFLGFELPLALNYAATVFWVLLLTNAYNLIDGFDGVATGLGAIAALGIAGSLLFRELYVEACFLLPLTAGCLGFLRYNRSPASIFLGDSGSLFIGFTLSWIALATVAKGPALASVLVPFLALGVPVFDVLLAVWRRLIRRTFHRVLNIPIPDGVFSPDREHIHHKLGSTEDNPRNVAALLYLVNCVFVLVGIISLLYKEIAQGIFVLFFISTVVFFIRYIARVEIAESRIVLRYGFARSMQVVRQTFLFASIEFILLCGALYVAIWATYVWYWPSAELVAVWRREVVQWVLLIVLGTTGLRMYYFISNKYISTARMLGTDFVFVLVLLAAVCSIVTNGFSVERIQASYYFSLAAVILVTLRLIRFAYLKRF